MKITVSELRKIIKEVLEETRYKPIDPDDLHLEEEEMDEYGRPTDSVDEERTPKYDDHPALKGKQKTKLPDALQKGIISKAKKKISESLQYHVDHGAGVEKNIFRPGSEAFFALFREARELYLQGKYTPSSDEELELLESNIGEFGMYEGKKVPLDFPELISDLEEAKYKGREVTLGKKGATRTGGGRGRVYVRNKKTSKVVKVEFGSNMPDAMGDSKEDKKRRKSFGNRHNCSDKDDNTKPGYWSCRATKLFGRNIAGWW